MWSPDDNKVVLFFDSNPAPRIILQHILSARNRQQARRDAPHIFLCFHYAFEAFPPLLQQGPLKGLLDSQAGRHGQHWLECSWLMLFRQSS